MASLVDRQRLLIFVRRAAVCAVAALAVALVLEWLQVTSEPKVYAVSREEGNGISALNMDAALLVYSAHQNGAVIVAGRPAQITLNLRETLTMDKILVSTDRIDGAYVVRVLYAAPGEELSVEHSTEVTAHEKQNMVMLDIPKGEYDKLAVQVAGSLAITAIEYSTTDDIPMIPLPSVMLKKRIAKLAILLFVLFLALTYLSAWRRLIGLPGKIAKRVCEADRKAVFRGLLIFIVSGGVAYLLARWLVFYYLKKDVNWITNIFCIFFAISAGCLFSLKKTVAEKPEVIFLVFVILSGSLLSFFAPASATVSWDDGFHSINALHYSYLGYERRTEQDIKSINDHEYAEYHLSDLDQWHADQNELYEKGTVIIDERPLEINHYWSMTQGIGLFLGRVLRMPYWVIWSMGRLGGLIAYALIGYFAIRRLHSGRMIMTATLMIPVAVFLASQYSYDPAVNAFLALGMSYCFAEWQEMDLKITWKNAIIMVGAIFAGCLVKAIYFPLFMIPVLLPKAKFKDGKQRKYFIMICLSAMVAIILYFMIPFLTGGGGGDARGGGDVNAFGQVAFILHNPLRYTQILLRFLRGYLGPENAIGIYSFFAYLGNAPLGLFYLGLMVVVCFTDRSETELTLTDSRWTRILSLFFLFGTMCLVATALYIDFTPVGYESIEGCQSRYLYPVVFPAMILLGSGRIVNRTNRRLYNGILLGIMGYINYIDVLCTCLGKYA